MTKLKKRAMQLEKYETQAVIGKDGKYHVISGTPMGFEDEICNQIINMLSRIGETAKINKDDSYRIASNINCDDLSELRDKVEEIFCKTFNTDITYGFEEF